MLSDCILSLSVRHSNELARARLALKQTPCFFSLAANKSAVLKSHVPEGKLRRVERKQTERLIVLLFVRYCASSARQLDTIVFWIWAGGRGGGGGGRGEGRKSLEVLILGSYTINKV